MSAFRGGQLRFVGVLSRFISVVECITAGSFLVGGAKSVPRAGSYGREVRLCEATMLAVIAAMQSALDKRPTTVASCEEFPTGP